MSNSRTAAWCVSTGDASLFDPPTLQASGSLSSNFSSADRSDSSLPSSSTSRNSSNSATRHSYSYSHSGQLSLSDNSTASPRSPIVLSQSSIDPSIVERSSSRARIERQISKPSTLDSVSASGQSVGTQRRSLCHGSSVLSAPLVESSSEEAVQRSRTGTVTQRQVTGEEAPAVFPKSPARIQQRTFSTRPRPAPPERLSTFGLRNLFSASKREKQRAESDAEAEEAERREVEHRGLYEDSLAAHLDSLGLLDRDATAPGSSRPKEQPAADSGSSFSHEGSSLTGKGQGSSSFLARLRYAGRRKRVDSSVGSHVSGLSARSVSSGISAEHSLADLGPSLTAPVPSHPVQHRTTAISPSPSLSNFGNTLAAGWQPETNPELLASVPLPQRETQGLYKERSFSTVRSYPTDGDASFASASIASETSGDPTYNGNLQAAQYQRQLRKKRSDPTFQPALPTVEASPPEEYPPPVTAGAVQRLQEHHDRELARVRSERREATATKEQQPSPSHSSTSVNTDLEISEQLKFTPPTRSQSTPPYGFDDMVTASDATHSKWKLPSFGKRGQSHGNGNELGPQPMKEQASNETLPGRLRSVASRKSGLQGFREDWDSCDGRDRAARQIAEQQRAANDSRLAGAVGLLDQPIASGSAARAHEPPGFEPSDNIRTSRTNQMSRGRSKLERMMGENAPSGSAPDSNSPRSAASSALRDSPAAAMREAKLATASVSVGSPASSSADLGTSDEASCPVCLELLSFRLTGEKPHVVPACGHALHHACFSAVYGPPEAVLAQQGASRGDSGARIGSTGPPGMCGVCRRPIVLGDEKEARRNKLAGMMGVDSSNRGRTDSVSTSHGSNTDDPLEGAGGVRSRSRDMLREVSGGASSLGHSSSSGPQLERGMVYPLIKVRPEYGTIYRKDPTGVQGKQNVVCVLSVEVTSRRPPPTAEEEEEQHRQLARHYASLNNGLDSIQDAEDQISGDDEITYDSNGAVQAAPSSNGPHTMHQSEGGDSDDTPNSPQRDGSPDHARKLARPVTPEAPAAQLPVNSPSDDEGFSFGATPAAGPFKADDPFKPVFEDLKSRIIDWKGHSIERFGALQLYDYLGVRQDDIVRDFYVYLFHEALLCVAEERKKEKGLSRFMSAPDKSPAGENSRSPMISGSSSNKPPLKLKGRIWLRHIRRVQDTSSEGNLSLSVKLDDESLNHFVLCFKNRNTLETWRSKLVELVDLHKPPEPAVTTPPSEPSTPARIAAAMPSLAATPGSVSRRGTTASNASGKAGSTAPALAPAAPITPKAAVPPQNRDSMHVMSRSGSQGITPALHQQWSASGGLDPSLPPPELLPHTPIDLVIMVSVPYVPAQVPTSGSVSSSAALKLRLIRSTLDFVVAHLGPKDRLALVAYSVGSEGEVRRTALLSASKERSRAKLEQFVECIGQPWMGEGEDPFRESLERLGGSTDRTDTITAVNVGLDIVLQRKSRNPITGMLLINDTADAPRRGQMDLVMARAEAANVPIHSFGFGKSHDPSSLWLISNHTRGSYTFVREWYQLRECIAGCIGSLMSIALTELRLHILVPSDNHFRVRKVAGPTGAIVSASGKDVDIELGELRYGDSKELLVELEFDFNALVPFITEDAPGGGQNVRKLAGAAYEQGSATDDFMHRLGLQGLNLSDVDADQFAGVAPENLIEEVAVFSVDAGFKDPAINVSTSRLPDPCVLTLEVDAKSLDPMAGTSAAAGGAAAALADPVVTRRRIEILVSDMITRSLLVVSRKNHAQALQILTETRRIVDTVLQATPLPALQQRGAGLRLSTVSSVAHGSISSGGSAARSGPRRQREALHRRTADSLLAIIEDLDMLIDGLEQSRSSFDRDGRNSGAQQAMILRDQRAWTSRTDTEWLRFAHAGDNGPAFTARAAVYASLGGH